MARCDFANARLGGMRSGLLGRAGVWDLVRRGDAGARWEALLQSDYGGALRAAQKRATSRIEAAEQAFSSQLASDMTKIAASLEGRRARRLFRTFFLLEDAASLKALFRSRRRTGPSSGLAPGLLATPSLSDAAVAELQAQPTLDGAVALAQERVPALGPALRKAWGAPDAARDELALEIAFDRGAFAAVAQRTRGLGEDAGVVRRHAELRADLTNGITLLKLEHGAAAEDYFVPGGARLDLAAFMQISALQTEVQRRHALAAWLARNVDARAAARLRSAGPHAAEEWIQTAAAQQMRREARARPLSLAVALSFVLERRAEVQRLRLALRGAEFGLPAGELVELLEA